MARCPDVRSRKLRPTDSVAGRSCARRCSERAGVGSVDAMISGIGAFADVLYPAGLLADQRSHLILPEVTDPSFWLPDPPLFIDPDQNKLLRLFNSATPLLAINRDYVDPAT